MHKNVIAEKIGILEPNFSQITTVVLNVRPSQIYHQNFTQFGRISLEKKANHDQTSYYF